MFDDKFAEILVDDVIKTTDNAALCLIEKKEYWIPWSQIDEGSDIQKEGDSGIAYLTKWICDKKGIKY